MAGRRPKPTALKELAGNPGHRPLNDRELKPPKVAPEMPKGMARAAQREWRFITKQLMALNVLTNIDGKALAAYCDSFALWQAARKSIDKYGLVVESPRCDKEGYPIVVGGRSVTDPETGETNFIGGKPFVELKANPAVQIYNTMGKLMKTYLIEFGLTPASRSKLKIQAEPEVDPMETLMARRKGISPLPQAPGVVPTPAYFDTGKTVQEPAPALEKDTDFN